LSPDKDREGLLQRPSEYCANQNKPVITPEQLKQLTELGLDVNSSTNLNVDKTVEHIGETSKEKSETSNNKSDKVDMKNIDLNLSFTQNEENNKNSEHLTKRMKTN